MARSTVVAALREVSLRQIVIEGLVKAPNARLLIIPQRNTLAAALEALLL
jgi:hypothetical protein